MDTLKNRLWVANYYRYLHGVEFAHWPHFVMQKSARQLNKYKFNYAVKAFFAYTVYREVQAFRHNNRISFMPTD